MQNQLPQAQDCVTVNYFGTSVANLVSTINTDLLKRGGFRIVGVDIEFARPIVSGCDMFSNTGAPGTIATDMAAWIAANPTKQVVTTNVVHDGANYVGYVFYYDPAAISATMYTAVITYAPNTVK